MRSALVIALLFLVSAGIHWHLVTRGDTLVNGNANEYKKQLERYPYLSPRILQEYQNDILINFLPLRKDIRASVLSYQENIAVYFEYLPTGTSIGINEKAEFSPASLLKLPIVMAYFHARDRMGRTDDLMVTIHERDIDEGFGSLWKKGAGAKIRLSEAVALSIKDSDNTAAKVVAQNVPDEDFDAIYQGLDIDLQASESGSTVFTAKHYTSILKALYFSSVLEKDDSQEVLDLLANTKFQDKLPAGVPDTVRVSHKVGILGEMLYSDCGIVYVPKRPYALCMISAGTEKEAQDRMQTISKKVYNFVSQVNK